MFMEYFSTFNLTFLPNNKHMRMLGEDGIMVENIQFKSLQGHPLNCTLAFQ
jgi:hypothetical protein